MASFILEPGAEDDLDRLWDVDEDAAATILVLLDELENGAPEVERLFQKGFRRLDDPAFDVDRFEEFWRQGLNLLRLKLWDHGGSLVPYRILYAYDPRFESYHALAIIDRDFAYDSNHPTVQRVVADYEALGLQTFR